MSNDRGGGAAPATPTDPSLASPGHDGATSTAAFPETVVGTRLVLYQTEDGAVDLRWHIDPADIAQARAAFGTTEAHPVLRLHRLGTAGDNQPLADADLGDDRDAEGGLAHYAAPDAEGLLQAEIGLTSDDGGWLLIARSNGLPAAAAVGVDFLKAPGPTVDPTAEDPQDGGNPDDGPQTPPLRLKPEFPLVEPVYSERARSAPPDSAAPVAVGGHTPVAPALRAHNRHGMDLSLGAVQQHTDLAALGIGLPGTADASPPPGGVVPRLAPRPPQPPQIADTSRNAANSHRPEAQVPLPGSGPLRPQADGASLHAELVVHGSAPPYTLLDLGGHAYRVGPGGRFVLHIPIGEHQVIMRVLAALPRLPVAPRDDATG